MHCIETKCSECCKRYWITLLPAEAKAIAAKLGLSEQQFTKQKCTLVAHLYARKEKKDRLTVNSQTLPKKAVLFFEKNLGQPPSFFLVLPCIALKRNAKGECVFLKKGKCEIHSFLPAICRLFPFISLSEKPLPQLYPFCAALQEKEFEHATGSLNEKQRKKVNAYFNAVEKNGFLSQWKALPDNALFLFEGEKEFKATKKEFLQFALQLL